MQKRGQGEQFTWIFVLIAGAIILAFFTVFTFQYIQLQEKRQNLRAAQTLGENIRLLESTEQALDADAFPLGGIFQFQYACAEGHSFLTINNDYTQDLSDHILFMPKTITTTAFRAWIAAWTSPYYIAHVLYFEHPDTHHYFIVDSIGQSFVSQLNLPRIFSVTTLQRSSFSPPSDQTLHTRVTFFTQTPPTATERAAIAQTIPRATVIHIQPMKEEVTFYDQQGNPVFHQTVPGKELLLGALFSDDPDQYTCLLNRSLTAFDRTTRIYTEKAKLLPQLSQNPDCNYQLLQQSLLTYRQQPSHRSSLRPLLEDQNRDLSGKGCQVVF